VAGQLGDPRAGGPPQGDQPGRGVPPAHRRHGPDLISAALAVLPATALTTVAQRVVGGRNWRSMARRGRPRAAVSGGLAVALSGFWAVYRREMLSLWVTPLAWLACFAFLLLQGISFYIVIDHFAHFTSLS